MTDPGLVLVAFGAGFLFGIGFAAYAMRALAAALGPPPRR